jgi:hypothetical protein
LLFLCTPGWEKIELIFGVFYFGSFDSKDPSKKIQHWEKWIPANKINYAKKNMKHKVE